jgi:CHAT domain-containing protein
VSIKSIFLIVAFIALCGHLHAQEALNLILKFAGNRGTKLMEAVDSVDFQFAISVNENAGFFDIEQKGETWKQLLYQQKEQRDKTIVDLAREALDKGVDQYGIRRYEMAEQNFLTSKNMLEQRGLTRELVYLRALSNLGLIYLTQGRTLDAEKNINRSLSMSEQALGKSSAAYVANLNNMARLHQAMGKYNEAEKEFTEGLTLCDEVFGDGKAKALLLNNKAMLFLAMGRYKEATALMTEAMTQSAKAPKKARILFQGEGFDNRKFQVNQAFIQQISGDYVSAEANFRAIEAAFKEKDKNTPEYAGMLNQIGILFIQMGKMDKVEAILKASMEIYKKRYTENNIYTAKVMNDLGNFYRINARYADAEAQLTKALTIREVLLGTNHPQYIRSLEDVAILYWKSGKTEKAYASYKQVMDKSLDFINRYFPPMSEAEKASYWEITAPRFQRFYNFALEMSAGNPTITKDFFQYHVATKALLLSSTNRIKESILTSGNKQLVDLYGQWQSNKEMLVKLYAYSKAKLKAQNIDLVKVEQETNDLEKRISEQSVLFRSSFFSDPIQMSDIESVLSADEAVVDIVRLKVFKQDFTNDVQYVAFVLKKGMVSPAVVLLDNGNELEGKAMQYYKTAATKSIADNFSYGKFWAKIEQELNDIKTIYFSPDGTYNKLNINTLKDEKGEYLIKKHDVVLLGNSKDLIKIKSKRNTGKLTNALLLGFPDYATDRVTPLPGTKKEVDAIAKLLSASGYRVTQHMEKNATEENIKEANGQSMIHIATHGFFAPEKEIRDGSLFGIHAENASNNPLLRSGLMMANINTGNPEATADLSQTEDGVLTAYEAMNLNLTGTNLVVLSACETGLGEIKSGEGVYGLQRAFLVAGAETLIMSLWKVDDEATQQLMTNFYSNWVKSGNKQTAFKEAQLQLMAKFPEPYYWGAFVMVGM